MVKRFLNKEAHINRLLQIYHEVIDMWQSDTETKGELKDA